MQQPDGTWENSLSEIYKYLRAPENKLTMAEFEDFWKSLTQEEKDEFKRAELK